MDLGRKKGQVNYRLTKQERGQTGMGQGQWPKMQEEHPRTKECASTAALLNGACTLRLSEPWNFHLRNPNIIFPAPQF